MRTLKVRKTSLWALFIVFALTTEFYFVEAFGGALRPYHLMAPVLVLLLSAHLPKLLSSPLFLLLGGIVVTNIVAAIGAADPTAALLSVGLLIANCILGVSIALLLMSEKVSPRAAIGAFLLVSLASVAWAFLQVFAFKAGGINLGLSFYQNMQIQMGFAPGFRTEANTLAKFLNVALLLTFPTLLAEKSKSGLLVIMLLFAAGLVLSFTRSVLYSLPITLFLIYLWYLKTGKGRPLTVKPLLIFASFFTAFSLYIVTSSAFNSYATYKIANFFNTDEIVNGDSSAYRLALQATMIDSLFQSPKNFFLGSGWGQIYFFRPGWEEVQAGGADIVVFTAYGGVFSGLFYLLAVLSALRSASKMSSIASTREERLLFQGVMFATLGLFITGSINGSIIAPEYWIVFGLGIYSSYRLKVHHRAQRIARTYARVSSTSVPDAPFA